MGAGADGSCFFSANGRQRVSEMFAVIDANRTHGNQRTLGVGCGGIEAATESCLQHQPIQIMGFEVHQRCGDQPLKCGEVVLFRKGFQRL